MNFILYVFIGLSALSAIGILIARHVFYATLLLLVCLLSLAGIYLTLQAEFLAVTQIIIYAGGISVLIIFGIMLTATLSGKSAVNPNRNFAGGILVAVAFLAIIGYSINKFEMAALPNPQPATRSVAQVGLSLFTDYVAPFELAGLLLLISLVAAAVIASQLTSHRKND